MSFAFEILIRAPIDVVFDYVNDDKQIKEWNMLVIENRYSSSVAKENPRVGG